MKNKGYLKTKKIVALTYLNIIPQGTVDDNLGPDRLEGTKVLDPNYFRQPTL